MIIPAEAAGPNASASRRFAEERKPRPVDGLSGVREELPNSLPQPRRNDPAQRLASPPRGYDTPERRQGDRRQTSTPKMLNTRATRSRRQTALRSAIDVRI
jgi:hypothetical protein